MHSHEWGTPSIKLVPEIRRATETNTHTHTHTHTHRFWPRLHERLKTKTIVYHSSASPQVRNLLAPRLPALNWLSLWWVLRHRPSLILFLMVAYVHCSSPIYRDTKMSRWCIVLFWEENGSSHTCSPPHCLENRGRPDDACNHSHRTRLTCQLFCCFRYFLGVLRCVLYEPTRVSGWASLVQICNPLVYTL